MRSMAIPTTSLNATVVKILGEEFHSASSLCLKPHLFVAVCGDEDRRNRATIRVLHSGQPCQTELRCLPAWQAPRSQGAKRRESFLKRTIPRNVSIATFVLGSSRRRAAGARRPELCPQFAWYGADYANFRVWQFQCLSPTCELDPESQSPREKQQRTTSGG